MGWSTDNRSAQWTLSVAWLAAALWLARVYAAGQLDHTLKFVRQWLQGDAS